MEITISTPEGSVALSGTAKALSFIITSLELSKPKHQGVVHEPKSENIHVAVPRKSAKKRKSIGAPTLCIELIKQGYFNIPKTAKEVTATLSAKVGRKVTGDCAQQAVSSLVRKGILNRSKEEGQHIKYFEGDVDAEPSVFVAKEDMQGHVQKLIVDGFFTDHPRTATEVASQLEENVGQKMPLWRVYKPIKLAVKNRLLKSSKAPGEYSRYWV